MKTGCKLAPAVLAALQADVTAIDIATELILEHVHGICEVYPKNNGLAPWEAGTTVVAGGAGAGTFGAPATVLPAAATAAEFDIHWINMEVLPANATYEMVFYAGATEVGRVRFARINNNESVNGVPFMMPLYPAGTAITAKCANSAGNTGNLEISVYYHQYP